MSEWKGVQPHPGTGAFLPSDDGGREAGTSGKGLSTSTRTEYPSIPVYTFRQSQLCTFATDLGALADFAGVVTYNAYFCAVRSLQVHESNVADYYVPVDINDTLVNATLPNQHADVTTVAAIDAGMLWTLAGVLAFVWLCSNIAFALVCQREYLCTFWSTETAAQCTHEAHQVGRCHRWKACQGADKAPQLVPPALPGRGSAVAGGQLGPVGRAKAEVVHRAVEAGAAELGAHARTTCPARREGTATLECRVCTRGANEAVRKKTRACFAANSGSFDRV